MYGRIGQLMATPGNREALAKILLSIGSMDGCQSYLVANDAEDEDALWVTEAWVSAEAHQASLNLPRVVAAIERARPLIAGFGTIVETEPVGSAIG